MHSEIAANEAFMRKILSDILFWRVAANNAGRPNYL